MAAAVVAAETAEVVDIDDEEGANDEAGSALGLRAAFLGDVKAPLPLTEANVATTALLPLSRSALTPPAIGDMLNRERPLPTLSSLTASIIPETWDGGDCGGVFSAF